MTPLTQSLLGLIYLSPRFPLEKLSCIYLVKTSWILMRMSDIWTEKHRPKKLDEIVGQAAAVQQMMEWAAAWKRGKPSKKALLAYGPAGTGKSIAAAALAREYGWDLIEMNASDKRTLGEIRRVAGAASTSGTLLEGTSGKRLIVLEEADNIHGTADRGGYKALKELIEQTRNPVILIANNQYSIPWDIRVSCTLVNFRRLSRDTIVRELQRVSKAEGIAADVGALGIIADESNGDLRSAIQDLQAVGFGRKKLTEEDAIPYRRDREKNVYDLINKLLRLKTAREAREFLWLIDMPPEDALAWISENIPRMIEDPESLVSVYDAISRAEIFLGRAKLKQAYGLWSYAGDLMSSGVAVRKGGRLKWTKFQPPSHVKRYSRTRGARAFRDSIARKLARHCHTSSKVARQTFLPYFALLKRDRKLIDFLSERLELTEPEMNFLKSL
jgi:replication factor C large subunit